MGSKIEQIFSQGFDIWMAIGFLGQGIFASRFVVQWIVSEVKKQSVIPVAFWYLSIIGSLLTLAYAIHKADPVFIVGYLFNSLIYIRNLYFIYSNKDKAIKPPLEE